MISLEQIRLLEGKITRAIELIRVLKDENSTLRKGLESAQKRMKELESLVDGFKTDQSEIETVIVRTLHTLDELEENASAKKQGGSQQGGGPSTTAAGSAPPSVAAPTATARVEASVVQRTAVQEPPSPTALAQGHAPEEDEPLPPKEELDIF